MNENSQPARWPAWRSPREFPRPGKAVMVTIRDVEGDPYVELAERTAAGHWMLVGDDPVADADVVAWMPTPPPFRDCDSSSESPLPDIDGQNLSD